MKSYNFLKTKERLGQMPRDFIFRQNFDSFNEPTGLSAMSFDPGAAINFDTFSEPRRGPISGVPPIIANSAPYRAPMVDPVINTFSQFEPGRPFIPQDIPQAIPVVSPSRPTTRTYSEAELEAEIQRRTEANLRALSNAKNLVASTFTPFEVSDQLTGEVETITAGIWSDNISSLITHFTSSMQTVTQRRYYTDVYQELPTAEGAAVQYSIAYGHYAGSGSDSQGQLNDSPSRAIYAQYRRLLLEPGASKFALGNGGNPESVYIINIKRNRLKERLDEGNFELPLRGFSDAPNGNATGSGYTVNSTIRTLIDDSSINPNGTKTSSGRVYNVVSGSIANGVFLSGGNPIYYGLVYPDHGVIVLNGDALDSQLGFETNKESSVEGNNHFRLFHSISSSCLVDNGQGDKFGFMARNSEKITSTHYFVRIKNSQYNFSNNPTFATGSNGSFTQDSFVNDPKTYITTVGLYDNKQQLLAVAKLSKPLLKSFTRESLIRVKLDF